LLGVYGQQLVGSAELLKSNDCVLDSGRLGTNLGRNRKQCHIMNESQVKNIDTLLIRKMLVWCSSKLFSCGMSFLDPLWFVYFFAFQVFLMVLF